MNVWFTIQILIIVIIAFLLVTAADELLDRLILQVFGLSRESIWSWVIIFIISLILLFAVLHYFEIGAHEVFGLEVMEFKKN
jgi:hypothetical protein